MSILILRFNNSLQNGKEQILSSSHCTDYEFLAHLVWIILTFISHRKRFGNEIVSYVIFCIPRGHHHDSPKRHTIFNFNQYLSLIIIQYLLFIYTISWVDYSLSFSNRLIFKAPCQCQIHQEVFPITCYIKFKNLFLFYVQLSIYIAMFLKTSKLFKYSHNDVFSIMM